MKKPFALILGLLMSLGCSASEIVAWKVPLRCIVWQELETEGIVRLESAPEKSPFFKQGDELWQITKLPDAGTLQPLSADWVIWNASAGRIVAKADWTKISALNDLIQPGQFPNHLRFTAKLLPVVDAAVPAPNDSMPIGEVSLLSLPGMRSIANWSGDGNSISAEVELVSSETGWIDARLFCSAKAAGQAEMEVNTSFIFRAGEPKWVARDFDGKLGYDLVVSAVRETFDKAPLHERVMIQNGDQIEPLMFEIKESDAKPIHVGNSGWMVRICAGLYIKDVISLAPKGENQKDGDPFVESSSGSLQSLPEAASIKPPVALRPWLRHEVLDAREWFQKIEGLPRQEPGDFIGYEPITGNLFVFSSNQTLVESLSQLFMPLDGSAPIQLLVTIEGAGQTCLLARSGQKTTLSRTAGGEEPIRLLEIEPTLDQIVETVDLRLVFEDKTDPKKTVHSTTALSLKDGEWSEIGAGKFGDGEKSSLRVKAEIVRESP